MNALVDTNILLRLADVPSPLSALCKQAVARMDERGDSLFLCAQVACEFWAAATRPRSVNGLGLTPSGAEKEMADFERTFAWLTEPMDIAALWRKLVNRYAVVGKQAHDARLVAFMQAHGLTDILTLNPADFARYDGIRCLRPADVR